MDVPSREQFIQQVIEITRNRFPLVKIARAEQAFTVQVNGNSASLENLYRHSAQNPDQVQHTVERWMVELLRASEGIPDEQGKFDEVKDRILPMVLTERAGDVQVGSPGTELEFAL